VKLVKIKHFKIFVISLTALFLIAATGIVALFYFFPEEKLLQIISEQTEKNLKRKVSIEKLKYSIRGISLKNVLLHDGISSDTPVLLSADEASLGFSLFALLEKKISINYVVFDNLKVTLKYNDKGKSNLQSLLDEIATPGKKSSGNIQASIDKIRLNNMTLRLENPPGNLAPLEGTYRLSALVLLQLEKNKNITITNCTVNLPEKRGKGFPDIKISITPTRVLIEGKVGLKNTSIVWTYAWTGKPAPQPYSRVTGDVTNLKLSIFPPGSPEGIKQKTSVLVEGNVKATSTLLNSPKIVHAEGFARVDQRKRTVFLSGINVRIDTTRINLDKLFFSFNGSLHEFNAPSLSASFSDIRPLLSVIPAQLFGKAEGSLSYKAKKINASLNISGAGYGYQNKLVSGLTTKINIANNLFKKENIPVKVLGNPVKISLASMSPELDKIFINMKAGEFKVPESPKSKVSSPKKASPTAISFNIPLAVGGRIDVARFSYGKLSFHNLAVNYSIKKNHIEIKQWQSELLKGMIRGKGSIVSKGISPTASLSFTFKDIRIQELGLMTDSLKDRFFGIGAGNGNLSYDIGSGDLLTGMKGFVEFQAARGKIVDTGIQNGLGIWLSELKYKLKDLEFNTIYGNFLLNKGKYTINSFVFNSDDIRLKLNGLIDSNWEAKGMNISLEFTRSFIQDLPTPAIKLGLDRFLRGRWYIIPFVANGSIKKAKNIKRQK